MQQPYLKNEIISTTIIISITVQFPTTCLEVVRNKNNGSICQKQSPVQFITNKNERLKDYSFFFLILSITFLSHYVLIVLLGSFKVWFLSRPYKFFLGNQKYLFEKNDKSFSISKILLKWWQKILVKWLHKKVQRV